MQLSMAMRQYLLIGLGGIVHWWYYARNRDNSQRWNIQPERFPAKHLDSEAMSLEIFNYNLATVVMATQAWGVFEHDWFRLHVDIAKYGCNCTVPSCSCAGYL